MHAYQTSNPYAIAGYANRLSARPGERLDFMVSTTAQKYTARLIKLHRAAKGYEDVGVFGPHDFAGREQPINVGNYISFPEAPPAPDDAQLTATVRPSLPLRGEAQAILCWGDTHGLLLDEEGRLEFRWGAARARLETPLNRYVWYRVAGRVDRRKGLITVSADGDFSATAQAALKGEGAQSEPGAFSIAAAIDKNESWRNRAFAFFDGKIENPEIAGGDGRVLASWDFSYGPGLDRILDVGGGGFHGRMINHPRKAATGSNWRSISLDYKQAPNEFAAIAFQSDGMTDAGWRSDFSWSPPADLAPGFYAMLLECDGGVDHVPFAIRASRDTAPKTAFLAPTFTYLAYANERHWWNNPDIETLTGQKLEDLLCAGDRWAADNKLLSSYDLHADGSGCCYTSYLRPILNFRADYQHGAIKGPHLLGSDLYLTDWLEDIGCDFDILTEHDLDHEGLEALSRYDVVISGSHPEYSSAAILDSIGAYVRSGGRFMYLGGNGFYAVATSFVSAPHTLEVRRGHFGTRPWDSEPGEVYHASTGEYGGAWRIRGRPPQQIFGIGFSGVSFGGAAPFVRTDASRGGAYDYIFEGVTGDVIDTPGDIMGGPAAFEFDRAVASLGSSCNTVVLASAVDFKGSTFQCTDDLLATGYFGKDQADIAYTPYPGGGAVFAIGSVAWTACLHVNDGDNDVAKVTRNALYGLLG